MLLRKCNKICAIQIFYMYFIEKWGHWELFTMHNTCDIAIQRYGKKVLNINNILTALLLVSIISRNPYSCT